LVDTVFKRFHIYIASKFRYDDFRSDLSAQIKSAGYRDLHISGDWWNSSTTIDGDPVVHQEGLSPRFGIDLSINRKIRVGAEISRSDFSVNAFTGKEYLAGKGYGFVQYLNLYHRMIKCSYILIRYRQFSWGTEFTAGAGVLLNSLNIKQKVQAWDSAATSFFGQQVIDHKYFFPGLSPTLRLDIYIGAVFSTFIDASYFLCAPINVKSTNCQMMNYNFEIPAAKLNFSSSHLNLGICFHLFKGIKNTPTPQKRS
jgi:hypothetical protein